MIGLDRRLLLAGGLMLPGAVLAAKLAPPDAEVNESAVHWPIGGGREQHGFMAVSARARGRQPAVLVIGGRDTPDAFARALVHSVAQAGFVACTINAAAVVPDRLTDDLRATAAWLANGRYGTGRIGAIGLGSGTAGTIALAAGGALVAAVLFGEGTAPAGIPILSFRRQGSDWQEAADPNMRGDWAESWQRALHYLRAHLT